MTTDITAPEPTALEPTALEPTALEPTALEPTAPATVDAIDAVDGGALVGNPRRTRGLDASVLPPRQPANGLVGNPRRTRRLDAASFDAA